MSEHPTTPIRPVSPATNGGMSSRTKALCAAGAGVLVVTGVVGAAVAFEGSSSAPRPVVSAASSGVNTRPDGPNGCVGGADVSTAISTAFNEPRTPKGAIQFVATVQRWLGTSSVGAAQMSSVGSRLVNPTTLKVYTDQIRELPAGATTGYNTQNSTAWVKSFDANKGTATVLFTGQFRASQGGQSATRDNSSVVTLTTQNGHWYMANQGVGDASHDDAGADKIAHEITAGGGPLSGGC